jgi:hypothetical protein
MLMSHNVLKRLVKGTHELVGSFLESLKKYGVPEDVYNVSEKQLPVMTAKSVAALSYEHDIEYFYLWEECREFFKVPGVVKTGNRMPDDR